MAKNLLLVAGSSMILLGTIMLQGCFDSGPGYGYGPGYYASPAYSGPAYYSEPRYYAGSGYESHDVDSDAWAIRQNQANIRHDKQELREDLEHRDYGAAAHERAEIQQRRANVRDRKADLNADLNY